MLNNHTANALSWLRLFSIKLPQEEARDLTFNTRNSLKYTSTYLGQLRFTFKVWLEIPALFHTTVEKNEIQFLAQVFFLNPNSKYNSLKHSAFKGSFSKKELQQRLRQQGRLVILTSHFLHFSSTKIVLFQGMYYSCNFRGFSSKKAFLLPLFLHRI